MSDLSWYRVVDPLSPLHGCDVHGLDDGELLEICALRRVDVFVGDRPYQLIAPEGQTLGLLIVRDQLEPSPIQDEVVELATDLPYGTFLEEIEHYRDGGECLHLVAYERAFQVALRSPADTLDAPGHVVISRTTFCDTELITGLVVAFEAKLPTDEMKMMIKRLP